MKNIGCLATLSIVVIIEVIALFYFQKRTSKNNTLIKSFIPVIICMIFWCMGLIFQIITINILSEDLAFYIDCYLVFPYIVLMPVTIYFFAETYEHNYVKFKVSYLALFIVPCITMFVLITNNKNHLFYEHYSINFNLTKFGPYNYVHCAYTYGLLLLDIYKILKTSVKNGSFFTRQNSLIIIGILIPLVVNILGTFSIIPMNIYLTPIAFCSTIVLWAIAIFYYDFMNISPIALNRIVNQMSDAYVVLNTNYVISDCNKAFEDFFNVQKDGIISKSFYELALNDTLILQSNSFGNYLEKAQTNNKVYRVDAHFNDNSKYFNIEISALTSEHRCVGILILFKDTTQHILDMEALKNNQDILMERERLATLGQMVGGIAHNLKTPIMSIAGAMDGLQDLVAEYEKSIDDTEVTKEDHHEIAHDMNEWITKVNSYDAYMSDVITAVKGQTVNFSSNTTDEFTIDELLKRVNILMRHELKSALITLNVDCKVDKQTTLTGNVNSLVQIVNNLISNAIQAYKGEQNKNIDLTILQKNNNIMISIKDYGCGIPEKIQKRLFSEMVTTKGHNGTGLGLFMSYSTIKGHLNGDLTFESKEGKGSTFNIILPFLNRRNNI